MELSPHDARAGSRHASQRMKRGSCLDRHKPGSLVAALLFWDIQALLLHQCWFKTLQARVLVYRDDPAVAE